MKKNVGGVVRRSSQISSGARRAPPTDTGFQIDLSKEPLYGEQQPYYQEQGRGNGAHGVEITDDQSTDEDSVHYEF